MKPGNSFVLDFTANNNVDKSTITFHSDNEKVAIVSKEGKITIISGGEVTLIIKARTNDNIIVLDAITLNIESSDLLLGDVTLDGIINGSDATLTLSAYTIISSGSKSPLSEAQMKAADVDKDGIITGSDATLILRYYTMLSSGTIGGDIPTLEEWIIKQ